MLSLRPYNGRVDLSDYFQDFEKRFFGDFQNEFTQIKTDIEDEGDRLILTADLPGFQKEDIEIDLDENILTIRAEHKEENEVNEKNYIRRERRVGAFQRSFDVNNIQKDAIDAAYENGVLKLILPKLNVIEAERKKIEIR